MNSSIEPGKTYWVQVDTVRFKVKTIRLAAVPGWWYCEGISTGDSVVVPEAVLVAIEDETV